MRVARVLPATGKADLECLICVDGIQGRRETLDHAIDSRLPLILERRACYMRVEKNWAYFERFELKLRVKPVPTESKYLQELSSISLSIFKIRLEPAKKTVFSLLNRVYSVYGGSTESNHFNYTPCVQWKAIITSVSLIEMQLYEPLGITWYWLGIE